jgi:hypothetical protein
LKLQVIFERHEILVVSVSLLAHLLNDFAVIFWAICKHTMPSEMIILPVEQGQVVPAVNARNENARELVIDHLLDFSEDVWCKVRSLSTAEQAKEASLLVRCLALELGDPSLLILIELVKFCEFLVVWVSIFLDIKTCVDDALQTSDD